MKKNIFKDNNNQEDDINELKNKILLHQIEIQKMQKNIEILSNKINYITYYINQLFRIEQPPHY